MATHDYIISNASGAAVRADLNNALAAIATNNSSATEPTTTYAYQWWADTGSSPTVMKLRNAANSGWITLFQLDGEWTVVPFENGTAAAPSIYFKDSGTDTGIYSPGADQVAITTGGTGRLFVTSSGSVGIGTSSPSVLTHLSTSTDTQLRVESTSASSTNEAALQLIRGSNQSAIKNKAGGIEFFVQGLTNEIARFDSSGRLGIGTTSPGAKLTVSQTGGQNFIGFHDSANLVTANIIYDNDFLIYKSNGGTERFRIDPNGNTRFLGQNVVVTRMQRNGGTGTVIELGIDGNTPGTISCTTTATSYNTSSDYRLKENVESVTDGITRLQQLKPSRFNFIADPDCTVDGFIAHEVQAVVPEAITGEKDAVDDDGNPVYQGIDQSKLVPLLTAALQELVAEVESLKAEVAALKAQ